MASTVFANRGDSNWPSQPKGGVAKFMGKVPFTATKSNNPNPKFNKKRQFHHHLAPPDDVTGHVVDDFPASAASDDASSINRKLNDFNSGAYVSFRISSYSREDLIDLKNQLVAELEQIRELRNRIESNDIHVRSSSNKKPLPKKSISGNKRPLPSNFSKELKRLNTQENGKASTSHLMKSCSQILNKLMKNKHGYIFNSPVDVVGMGLHDYYNIIKTPMDLGTVKLRMSKNFYGSPLEFAADVRLTFNNAMLYNPKGHEVYVLAEQLLAKFEEMFRPLSSKLEDPDYPRERVGFYEEELQASSWDYGEADRLKKDRVRDGERIIVDRDNSADFVARSDRIGGASTGFVPTENIPPLQTQLPSPARVASPVRPQPVKSLKQPKPKAKDPNKREMSMEEKQKLGMGLQSLPQEKMDNVVQIIKKRNEDLRQDGDEIELDIEAMDTETLWELDRFVTNYKKMVSKIKRQALMVNNVVLSNDSHREDTTMEKIEAPMEVKKPKKGDAVEEDVDIGDEMPMSSFPPVEIEKDNDRASSSSSSSSSCSSDSSSSSDSGSGSSSGSDSDAAADDARS